MARIPVAGRGDLPAHGEGVWEQRAGELLKSRNLSAVERLLDTFRAAELVELELEHDASTGAIWAFQRHQERPSFTRRLLADIRTFQRTFFEFHRDHPDDAALVARFVVYASRVPGVFNLGGDLKYFLECLEVRDRAALKDYATSCIDVCYQNYVGMHSHAITASLVTGDALGGGFEAVLSGDFAVADERARFGLPEILYGLFPGMGAYTFLSRRAGQAVAERLILDGRVMSAAEIDEMHLLAQVAPAGQGATAMDKYLSTIVQRFDAFYSVFRSRQLTQPVSYEEMTEIADKWVEVAMRLQDRQLRKMSKLVHAQALRSGRLAEG